MIKSQTFFLRLFLRKQPQKDSLKTINTLFNLVDRGTLWWFPPRQMVKSKLSPHFLSFFPLSLDNTPNKFYLIKPFRHSINCQKQDSEYYSFVLTDSVSSDNNGFKFCENFIWIFYLLLSPFSLMCLYLKPEPSRQELCTWFIASEINPAYISA